MLENFDYWLTLALIILLLSLMFPILVYIKEQDKLQLKNDEWLLLRMQESKIITWKDLQNTAEIDPFTLRSIRKGEVERLSFSQLNQIATALNWTTEQLLEKLGLVKNQEVEILRHECQRLHTQLEEQKSELTNTIRESLFNQLQTLLTTYPSLRQMVQIKPDLPAKNLISLLTPLDNLLNSWQYETIGTAYAEVEYSPQLHQADTEIQPGEKVYVRFVGYRDGSRIICPAKVSRTLPGGMA